MSKYIRRLGLIFILFVHTLLLGYGAYVHSPVVDEPAYIVAGLSHWKLGRYELYRVNPPLIRMVAALPVLAAGYEEDWSGFYDGPGARPVFTMGKNFTSTNGERSLFLFMIARWACIPFSWLGAVTCYLWARDLISKPAGVFSCMLWCFSPNILGHASLIATDAHAASLGVAASYLFWRWLKRPTWTRIGLVTIALGLAQLAKTTLVLFYPLWPFLWLVYQWPNRRMLFVRDWLLQVGMLASAIIGSLYILNIGYRFEGSFMPLKEYHFVSRLFTGSVDPEEETDLTASTSVSQPTPSASSINRFANSWLGELPVPFPRHYLKGIDIQQRDFEGATFKSYLRGEFQDHGWWYYYLYALTIKVPLGTWLLGLLIVVTRVGGGLHRLGWRDELALLLPALFVFTVASSKSGFSHHLHYVLICFPFLFIWLSQATSLLLTSFQAMSKRVASSTQASRQKFTSLMVLTGLCWSMTSSIWIYPHSLSYFNELVGGPTGGPNHLLHSNVDWGQDLRYLKWWMKKQPEENPLHLAYSGTVNPAGVGFADTLPWPYKIKQGQAVGSEPSSFLSDQICDLEPGYYAISTNLLYGYNRHSQDGNSQNGIVDVNLTKQIRHTEPLARVGYSITIFSVEK